MSFRDRAEYAEEARIGPEALIPRSITKEIIAEVSFSPQQLKIMNKVIEEQIKSYARRFGCASNIASASQLTTDSFIRESFCRKKNSTKLLNNFRKKLLSN